MADKSRSADSGANDDQPDLGSLTDPGHECHASESGAQPTLLKNCSEHFSRWFKMMVAGEKHSATKKHYH